MYTLPTLLLALALPAAEAKFAPEARARTLTPYVDEQTLFVAHVDLTRLDTEAVWKWILEVGKLEAKDVEEPRREGKAWLDDLLKAGAKEMYAIVSLADLPNESPLVVVPLGDGVDAQAVRRALNRSKDFERLHFEPLGQSLVGGSAAARKRVQGERKVMRPELAQAFAAAGDTTAQFLLLPTPDMRRVLNELLPTLPKVLGGGSIQPLTHGLQWAAVGIDLPPKPILRLVLQAPDADSARRLENALARLLKALSQQTEVRDFVPGIDRLLETFTPRGEGDHLTLSLSDKEVQTFLPTLVRRLYQNAQRRTATNQLKQLALAMHNYAGTYKNRLPAVANFDKEGKPLLSWRVHLLPFVGEQKLYQQFHLDESWDSPHNKKLLALMPKVYQGPNRKLNAEGKTIFLLPVGKDAAFKDGPEGPRMPADFPDGTSNTIFIVEADDAHAVPWTKPEDLKIDPKHPERGLGGHFPEGFLAALADGSVRIVAKTISKTTLHHAFAPNDGQPMGADW